jgi:hypothetical protein
MYQKYRPGAYLVKYGAFYGFAASVLCLIKRVIVYHGGFNVFVAGKLLHFGYVLARK